MDLESVLAELRKERDALDVAILSLERLDRPGKPGPDRSPKFSAKSPASGLNGFHKELAPEEAS